MITFNTDGMVAQQFPFPAPVMDYILKNLQPQHLIKLYKCCKFFYAKYGQNIIRNLVIVDDGEEEMFHPNKTTICISNPALNKLIDFWISDSFIYNAPSNIDSVPSFSHCTIKKLEACDILLWEEYEVLTKAGTVEELKVGEIYDDDEDLIPVEDIIAAVPNATSIEICKSEMTPTTFELLAALDHQVKIKKFILGNMTIPQRYDHIKIFFNNHLDADCNVHFDFAEEEEDDDDVDVTRQINELLKEMEEDINRIAALILRRMKENNLN